MSRAAADATAPDVIQNTIEVKKISVQKNLNLKFPTLKILNLKHVTVKKSKSVTVKFYIKPMI